MSRSFGGISSPGDELRVAVVDFSHYEVVDAFVRVLQPICTELHLIVSDWIAADLKATRADEPSNVVLHVLPEADSAPAVHEILIQRRVDLCVFSTVDSGFEGYAKLFGVFRGKKLLVLHNVNFWLAKQKILRFFPVVRNSDHKAMLACVANADAVVVLGEELKRYASRRYRLRQPIVEFTTCISRERDSVPEQDDHLLSLVVPGQIELKRRNYHAALDSFQVLDKRTTEIVLLGRPFGKSGEEVLRRCRLLAAEGYRVIWYESYVPQAEFDRRMRGASVVLAPVVANTSFGGVFEQYGTSKITGAIPDMIRYGKPGILPSALPFPNRLESSVMTYASTGELTQILRRLSAPGIVASLAERAKSNAAHWEVSRVRDRFIAELESAGIRFPPLS